MSSLQTKPTPRKRKRVSPPDIAYQLALGRPAEGVVEHVWERVRTANEKPLQPYQFHFDAAWNILNVVRCIEKFARTYRPDVEPFVLHLDAHGKSSIVARHPARALAELFTTDFQRELRRAAKFYPAHRFHPFFQIFLDADSEHGRNNSAAVATRIEIASNNYVRTFSKPTNLDHHALVSTLHTLNALSKTILEKARIHSDEIKQFERGTQDNRTSAMQYAHHLISRAPNPFFAHFTVHRSTSSGGNGPVSYPEIRKFLSKLKRSIKRDIQENNYLGYTILLRHNAKIGYWLDGFIYLSDNLGQAPAALEELTQRWNATVGAKTAEINCYAWPINPDNLESVGRVLESITISTESDRYCRTIPLDGHRTFWCSQSPVAKLARRTQIRKRTARNAQRKTRALANSFARELQIDEIIDRATEQWNRGREKKKKISAARRAKAAETIRRKNNRNDSGS